MGHIGLRQVVVAITTRDDKPVVPCVTITNRVGHHEAKTSRVCPRLRPQGRKLFSCGLHGIGHERVYVVHLKAIRVEVRRQRLGGIGIMTIITVD